MSVVSDIKLKRMKIALAGIPNVGKSLIFNQLTGGRAWVGNWPGVTVEKKVGKIRIGDNELEVVDLPGIYSLTAYSVDELVARNFIVEERPNVVVCILNAANFERSLYLAISLLELGANVVLDLNMIDIAKNEGYEVDYVRLQSILKVPVVPTIATEGYGINELKKAILSAMKERRTYVGIVDYGADVEREIRRLKSLLEELAPELCRKYPSRWIAVKLLEGDEDILSKVSKLPHGSRMLEEVERSKRSLRRRVEDLESYITECRYRKALEIAQQVLKRIKTPEVTLTDLLDFVLTHKVLGMPIALSIMYLLFRFSFEVSAPLVDTIDIIMNHWLHDWLLSLPGLPESLKSFLADGILTGIGSVLVFLPVIAFFFLGFALLEDVGYMARIAFIVDKIFHSFHLPGKAAIPLVIGFGCNVPAVMAARTIEDENERKVAALIAPLSSCNARLPVYMVIAGAVLRAYAGAVILSLYALGILLALIVGWLFRKIIFKGPSTGFILELPPYLSPKLSNVVLKTWERTKRFLFKAGTVILLGVVVAWLLSVSGPGGYLGPKALEAPEVLERSWVGVIGHVLAWAFAPMKWDWRACAALLFGFIAKETVVGTMGILYGVGEERITEAIMRSFTPLTGYAYMAFVLIYVPCLATIAMIRNELGLKYSLLALIYEVILAYFVALSIVGIGHLMGIR